MLGTFSKDFYKWQLPKGIFLSSNFLNVQFLKWQLPKSVLATALEPQAFLAAAHGLQLILARPLLQTEAPQRT